MRNILVIFAFLFSALPAFGQQTPITATVVSPNGVNYAFATGTANIVCPGNQAPTYNGFSIQRSQSITGINGFGTFSMTVYDVNAIQPVGCAYTFAITDQTGVYGFTTGLIGGATQFPVITGSTIVDLSSSISAYAVPLPTPFLSFLGPITIGDCTKWTGLTQVGDAGMPCGGGGGGGSPVGNNGDIQIKNGSSFGSGVSLAANAGVLGNIALKVFASDGIRYASPSGNDSNDGLSWGTAKLTVLGACEALPGGSSSPATCGSGTVQFMDLTFAQPISTCGFNLMGGLDPNFASPPACWIKWGGGSHGLAIVGVPTRASGPNPKQARALMQGGSSADRNHPGIYLSALSGAVSFHNVAIQFPGRGIVVGECSNQTRGATCNTSNITFDNVTANINDVSGNGPTWDITGQSFWIWLINGCGAGGTDDTNSPLSDNAQAVLLDGRGNAGVGLIFITDFFTDNGGIKLYAGTNFGQVVVRNMTTEGLKGEPGVWIAATGGSGDNNVTANISDLQMADATTTSPGVQNDITTGTSVLVADIEGATTNVVGRAIVLSQYPANLVAQTVSPLSQGQTGFFGNKVVIGQNPDMDRLLSPTPVRYANLANTSSASWLTSFAGSTTSVTPCSDPAGGTLAGCITYVSGGTGETAMYYAANTPITVGSWYAVTALIRSTTSNGYSGNTPIEFVLNAQGFGSGDFCNATSSGIVSAQSYFKGDGEWERVWARCQVTAAPSNAGIAMVALTDATHNIAVYGPTLIPIGAGTVSNDEAWAIASALQPYSNICAVGQLCNVTGAFSAFVYPPTGVPSSNGSAWTTSFGVQGTDTNLLSAGTATGSTGALFCKDSLGGATTIGCAGGVFQVNGTGLSSSSTINFTNSAAFNGVTFTFSNPTAGQVQLGATGQFTNAALLNPSTTVNGQLCVLGTSCTVPFTTNGATNTSQSGLNLINSTANPVGLSITFSNPGTNQAKAEITGGTYTGTAAALGATPVPCSIGFAPTGILANGNSTGCASIASGLTTQTNSVNNISQSTLNLINSVAFNGLTFTFTNTGTGTVQAGFTGTLGNSGLTNSATTVNNQTCTLGSTCTVPPVVIIANASSTGTAANTLTKVTGAPSTAVIAATTDTGGIIGITTSGAGTTGNAIIQTYGQANCAFSSGTTAGDYVQISSATAGSCVDGGASYPTSGQVIGRVFSTNASAGTYQIDLFAAEIKANTSGNVGTGTLNCVTNWLTATSLGSICGNVTNQVLTAQNGGPSIFAAPGVPGTTNASSTPYTVQCDSSTTTLDRLKTLLFTNASGITVTVPDAGATGCGSNFSFIVGAGPGSGTVTVNRNSSSTFTVLTGTAALASQTTFNLTAGQYAAITSPDNANYLVRITEGGGGSSNFQTNGVANSTQTGLNLLNSNAFNGLTGTFTNISGLNVQLGFTGALANSGLTNSSITLNGQTVALGASGNIPFQTNSVNNTSLAGLNLLSSNPFNGVTFTFTNTGTNQVQLGASGTFSNAALTNSSLTVNNQSVSLGGSTIINPPFDKSTYGLSNPTADVTFTQPAASVSGWTFAGTAPVSVSTSTGTAASTLFNVNGVAGGATSNTTGTGGVGSAPSISGGTGGAGTGTNAGGGAGGNFSATAGNGGASLGTANNANGGSIVLTPGSAGTGGSGTAGLSGIVKVAGQGAGAYGYAQGADNCTQILAYVVTGACEEAPSSGMTNYKVLIPPVAANGVQTNNVAAAVDTQGFSGDTNHSATVTISSATSIGTTTLCSTANCPAGTYQINGYLDVTTACTATGGYFVSITYTDDAGLKTVVMPLIGTGVTASLLTATGISSSLALSSTSNFAQGDLFIRSTGSAAISYSTTASACGTGGPAAGKLYLSTVVVQ
jgi:hypothetical protein